MKKLQENQQAGIQYDQSSYDEQLHTIQATRREINAALDMLEKKTLKEMKDTLTYLQASSKRDFDECIRLQDELKQLRDAIQDISDKSKLELSFIAMRKSEDKIQQSDTFLKKNTIHVKVSITFEPGSEIVQFLSKLSGLGRIKHRTQPLMVHKMSKLSGLGRIKHRTQPLMVHKNPNKKFIKQAKSEQNMRISSDSSECKIRAICVLMDAQVLVVDDRNKKVKLLDQQYQVVSHMSVTTFPWEMCQITSHEVAMTLNDNGTRSNIHEVQFIAVRNRKLAEGKKLQLQHTCRGIACNQGDLYITADTALYKYTLSGKKVSEIYKDTSGPLTVYKCAVSPTGDKLYITNNSQHKLLTLTRDGTVLATFTDPALQDPLGVHVTPTGQVLVCGYTSNTILQVDSEGRRKVATFATQEDGVLKPYSVFYNRHTSTLIVGLRVNSSILLFKGQ